MGLLHEVATVDEMQNTEFEIDEDLSHSHPLRICVVTETYPPDVNGVALTLSRMVEGLRSNGHQVALVRPRLAQSHEMAGREDEQYWVRGLPLPMYKHVRLGFPATQMLKRLWTRQRPDVVHIATEGPLGWSALKQALKMKIPVTSDFRTNFHTYSEHYRLGWLKGPIFRYLKKFHNRCAYTMVPTALLKTELQNLGFERLCHVPRGVDTDVFNPKHRSQVLREHWRVEDDTLVLVCVARLAVEKNIEWVIQAWKSLRNKGLKSQLVLVGDGPLRDCLQAAHPEVVYAGFQRGADLSAHYASADWFVFASRSETFGNVTLEAMASGLAVLAFDDAAAGELITSGLEGVVVQGGEAEFISAAHVMSKDREALRRMGQMGRQRAMACSWAAVIDQAEAVFRRAMNPAASRCA
jgi:glycosyltransferase involved in cell wall biosynthesis